MQRSYFPQNKQISRNSILTTIFLTEIFQHVSVYIENCDIRDLNENVLNKSCQYNDAAESEAVCFVFWTENHFWNRKCEKAGET